jgi:hypothetical protein
MAIVPRWYWGCIVAPLVGTRVWLVGAALLGVRLLPSDPGYLAQWCVADSAYPGSPLRFDWLDLFARWDGCWYMDIALNGYSYQPGHPSNVMFAPLLPALMRAGTWLLGSSDPERLAQVGLAIANVSLLVALAYQFALLRAELGALAAGRAVLYLLVFPTSVFLSALYPHALFLALGAAALYHARRGQWWLVAILSACLALTRIYGGLIALPLAWEYVAQNRRRAERWSDWGALRIMIGPLTASGWTLYLWTVTGGPEGLAETARTWNRSPVAPWDIASHMQTLSATLAWVSVDPGPLVDGAAAAAFVGLTLAAWKWISPTLALFGTVLLAAVLSTSQLLSVSRYVLEIMPAFAVLGLLGQRRWFNMLYLTVAGTLCTMRTIGFALGYWVA